MDNDFGYYIFPGYLPLSMQSCTLLISTYNWPQALNLCLKSILEQSVLPAEIIIADDGSTTATADVITAFTRLCPVPVKHVWQPDEGFQLARIRNKGIVAAAGDYIIQVDGDLILHRDFIKDHIRFSKAGSFTTGSRVLLSPGTTEGLFRDQSTDISNHSAGDRNFLNRLRIPAIQSFLSTRYKHSGKYKYYVKGCNMAFWKKDLLLVNGYNEAFHGWGREDSEIAIRLINAGISKRFLKFGGITYHLYHKEADREMEAGNIRIMEAAIEKKLVAVPDGLDKYR